MFPRLLENGVINYDYENYQPWPNFKPIDSNYIGGLWRAHYLREVLCRDDLDCAAWREPIPTEILRSLRRFGECHAELIEMAQAAPEYYLRMASYSPALTLLAATYWHFRSLRRIPNITERITVWENLDTKELLSFTRFPYSKSFRRALNRIPIEEVFIYRFKSLRTLWEIPEKRRLLQHLPVITGENLWLFSCFPPILDPGIHQLAALEPKFEEFSILEVVSDLANRRELLCLDHWPYRNRIHSWSRLLTVYNQFLKRTNCLPEILPVPPIEGVIDEDFHIAPLKSRTALLQETNEMRNCIEQYCSSISQRKHYAYRLLKPERATVLIKHQPWHWIIEEAMTEANERQVNSRTMRLLSSWIRGRFGN